MTIAATDVDEAQQELASLEERVRQGDPTVTADVLAAAAGRLDGATRLRDLQQQAEQARASAQVQEQLRATALALHDRIEDLATDTALGDAFESAVVALRQLEQVSSDRTQAISNLWGEAMNLGHQVDNLEHYGLALGGLAAHDLFAVRSVRDDGTALFIRLRSIERLRNAALEAAAGRPDADLERELMAPRSSSREAGPSGGR